MATTILSSIQTYDTQEPEQAGQQSSFKKGILLHILILLVEVEIIHLYNFKKNNLKTILNITNYSL